MANPHKISFTKFHGLGNDFVVSRGRGLPKSLPKFAQAITDRHTGVGADGFIVILPPVKKANDARMRIFNADGSEPEMSGNGIRCAGAFLLEEGPFRRGLRIETLAGIKSLQVKSARAGFWEFEVGMGAPILDAACIPFDAGSYTGPIVKFPLTTQLGTVKATVTSMGNPHCSLFVQSFEAIDWTRLGAEIERNKHFPNRTNVEFVKVISRREIEVRFWERGVGKTMSSGTGSCGATVACILNGLTGRKVCVRTLAGNLQVQWPENGEVVLTGPVGRIARGTYNYPGA